VKQAQTRLFFPLCRPIPQESPPHVFWLLLTVPPGTTPFGIYFFLEVKLSSANANTYSLDFSEVCRFLSRSRRRTIVSGLSPGLCHLGTPLFSVTRLGTPHLLRRSYSPRTLLGPPQSLAFGGSGQPPLPSSLQQKQRPPVGIDSSCFPGPLMIVIGLAHRRI